MENLLLISNLKEIGHNFKLHNVPLFQNESWCTNEFFLHIHCLAYQTLIHIKGYAPTFTVKKGKKQLGKWLNIYNSSQI